MSFGKVSKDVMTDPSISHGAKSLYSLLCCYMDKSKICYPGIKKLSEDMSVSSSTVKRWLEELQDKKIITRSSKSEVRTTVTTILK